MDFGDGYGHMGGGGWLLMLLMVLVFWGLLVALTVFLVRSWRDNDKPSAGRRPPGPSPEDVLASRYARGEIDDEEFERRREVLERAAAGS